MEGARMTDLKRFATPGTAACVAVLLVAIGFELNEPLMRHVLEILGGLIAIVGLLTG
jgi:hypothetical protein